MFHMTELLLGAALARRRDLAGKVRITSGWDLDNVTDAMKTANMFVTSMQVPRENLRKIAPALAAIHFIGAGIKLSVHSTGCRKALSSPIIVASTTRKPANTS